MKGIHVQDFRPIVFGLLVLLLLGAVVSCRSVGGEAGRARTFSSPQVAGDALVAALKAEDTGGLVGIFGEGAASLLSSGDPVADREQRNRFVSDYDLAHRWDLSLEDTAVLETGQDAWPFPIPVVSAGGRWHFDIQEGAEEVLNRRIGRNELDTIQSCLAFVDAQREYYEWNPRGRAVPEYARFILSTVGERNGLYWPTSAGEAPSPLGPVYAAARSQGYAPTQGGGEPYHGYMYRVLRAQGASAPGGAYDYVQAGEMTEGFALLAWPAKYGASGVMSFLINQVGVLYEKDLGPETSQLVVDLEVFDPDESWDVVPAAAQAIPGS